MKKRYIGVVLSILVSICIAIPNVFMINALAEEPADNTDNTSLVQFMLQLGIYDREDYMEVENDYLTREQMASLLSVFYGIKDLSYPAYTGFPDVSEKWSSGHILVAVQNHLLDLYEDGLFRPDEYVTVEQVVRALINMTGYDILVKINGGTQESYRNIAYTNKFLTSSDNYDMNDPVTKAIFTKLLYNAVQVDLLELSSVGTDNSYKKEKGKNLLTEKLDIYEFSGVVDALDYVSLGYRENAPTDCVRIGDTYFRCKIDIYENLGTQVDVYYRQTDDDITGEILYIESRNTDDVLFVDAGDISNVTAKVFEYSVGDNDRARKVALNDDMVVIFNGSRMTYYTPAHLFPKQGGVKFVDTDSNGGYDTIIVEYEVNYVVDKVSMVDTFCRISDKSGRTSLYIDLEDEAYNYTLSDRGLITELRKIKSGDVLSIIADDVDITTGYVNEASRLYRMKLSRNTIEGKLTSTSEEYILIDGIKYEIAGDYVNQGYQLKIGTTYTFYMNYLNEVVSCRDTDYSGSYGILYAASSKKLLTEDIQLKIFTQDGVFKEFECNEKVEIDGFNKKDYTPVLNALKTGASEFVFQTGITVGANDMWQLIKYDTKDNKICAIDTLAPNNYSSKSDLTMFGRHDDGSSLGWFSTSGSLGGKFGVSSDIIMFELSQNTEETDSYRIIPSNRVSASSNNQYFFDGGEMNVAKAMIRIMKSGASFIEADERNNVMLYQKTINMMDEERNISAYMCGISLDTGKEINVKLNNENMISEKNIIPGDVIRWYVGNGGAAVEVQKTMSLDGNGTYATKGTPAGSYYNAFRCSYGTAYAWGDDYLMTSFEGNKPYIETYKCDRVSYVFIYDSAKNKVINATLKDIRTTRECGVNADTIGIFYKDGILRSIVIYR